MKRKNLQQDLGSHSELMEKSTALQTNKSKENLAPPNQLYNKCFSRQETQEKEKTYKLKTIKEMRIGPHFNNYLKCKWEIILQVKDRGYWHASQRKTQAYSIHNRKHLNIKDTI